MKFRLLVSALLSLLITNDLHAAFQQGKILEDIFCRDQSEYSYLLYLPTHYTPERTEKWPVLFLLGSGGGNPGFMHRFITGAEENGWILAMSTQCSGGFDQSEDAALAMIDDVFKTFHVDENACTAGGYSYGGQLAITLAEKRKDNITGLLLLNTQIPEDSVRTPAYIFCHASNGVRFNTMNRIKNLKEERTIDFVPMQPKQPSRERISLAMSWLTGLNLKEQGNTAQIEAFSYQQLNSIKEKSESDPILAYDLAVMLAEFKKFPDRDEAKKRCAQLKTHPDVSRYIETRKAMDDFIDDYIAVPSWEYHEFYTTGEKPQKDAAKLAEKYAGCPLTDVILQLGTPTEQQKKNPKQL